MMTGCSLIRPLDDHQYNYLARMKTMLRTTSCTSGQLTQIKREADYFNTYTERRSNKRIDELAKNILEVLGEMDLRYTVSIPPPSFCSEKTKEILELIEEEFPSK